MTNKEKLLTIQQELETARKVREDVLAERFDIAELARDVAAKLRMLYPPEDMEALARYHLADELDSAEIMFRRDETATGPRHAPQTVDYMEVQLPAPVMLSTSSGARLLRASYIVAKPPLYGCTQKAWDSMDKDRKAHLLKIVGEHEVRSLDAKWDPFFLAVAHHRAITRWGTMRLREMYAARPLSSLGVSTLDDMRSYVDYAKRESCENDQR